MMSRILNRSFMQSVAETTEPLIRPDELRIVTGFPSEIEHWKRDRKKEDAGSTPLGQY